MQNEEKKRSKRWLLTLLLPFALFAKAVYSMFKAFKGSEEKTIATDRELPEAAPYHRQTRVVQSGGGIPLTVTVYVPRGEGPFPAVIMVHSWGIWRIQCDALYAPSFARRGYVVVTYDTRGWGSSGGEVACCDPVQEMCDLEDMITWMISDESGIPVDPENIGITGVSYGGGHSFLIAARDERIKAAAPMNGWVDLNYSLAPNGCWKAVWSLFLFVSSAWAMKFNTRNVLVRWLKTVVMERDLRAVKGDLDARSAIHDVDKVKCPMFIVHSWNDDLFEPNQILDFYQKLDAPKRIWMSNGVHGYDTGRGDLLFPNRIWDETRKWFDYWLKGETDNGIADAPAVTYYQPWDGTMAECETWPPPGVVDVQYFLRGDHEATVNGGRLSENAPENHEPAELIINNTVSNLHSSGIPVVRLGAIRNLPIIGLPFSIPGDSIAFTSKPRESDTELVGKIDCSFSVSTSTKECQLNAFLYDVSPRGLCRLVSHGAAMRIDMEPGVIEELDMELIACAHRFKAGHRMRVVVCASDPLFVFPSMVPSYYRLFHTAAHPSSVKLPLKASQVAKVQVTEA